MEFIKRTFRSKKFWAFVTAFVTLLSAAMADGIIDAEEGRNLALLTVGYVASVALEDGLTNHNTNTTTVSTPGESNVTVTAPVEPAKPYIGPTGLQ